MTININKEMIISGAKVVGIAALAVAGTIAQDQGTKALIAKVETVRKVKPSVAK